MINNFIHHNVKIGENVRIGPNCSIGYDGFAFTRDDNNIPQFIEHNGGVIIEDGVEIQANVAIAKGIKQDDNTVIGKYTKLDNLVHIAHNCKIGEGNLMAAGAAFGGLVTVGNNNFFGINCTIKNDITIGNYNLIGMGSVVIANIGNYEVWAGNPAKKLKDNDWFR